MIIGLDYDGTYSADPEFWLKFASDAIKRGHRVLITTGRSHWSADMARILPVRTGPYGLTVIFCGPNLKAAEVLKQSGLVVDWWIDDEPGTIEPQRLPADAEDL